MDDFTIHNYRFRWKKTQFWNDDTGIEIRVRRTQRPYYATRKINGTQHVMGGPTMRRLTFKTPDKAAARALAYWGFPCPD